MTIFDYGTGETPEQEARRRRQNQNVNQSTSMLSPGTSPSAVTGGLLEQQKSFIPPTPATPGLADTAFSAAAEKRRLENQASLNAANMQNRQSGILGQIPQGNFVGSPDVLQNIVGSRTQEILPENRQVDIGGQPVVGGTAPMLDAAGISNMAAGTGTGAPLGPFFSAQNFFDDPGYLGLDRKKSARNVGEEDLGFTSVDDAYRGLLGLGGPYGDTGAEIRGDIASAAGDIAGAVGNIFTGAGGGGEDMQLAVGAPFLNPESARNVFIDSNIQEDFEDPNKETNKDSLEDGPSTGKDGSPPAVFTNPNMASLESQLSGFETGIGVKGEKELSDAYSFARQKVEGAGLDTVFLNKFFKQISQPLKFNENGTPFLPEFPGELLAQLTREVEQTVPNPAFLAMDPKEAAAAGVPDTITTVVPTIDPAGELLLEFYNEYIGNALLMSREAQNQKNQLAIAEVNANPYGLTREDQLEIEKIRTNPYNLTAEQSMSLQRQGLGADEFIELQLERERISAEPALESARNAIQIARMQGQNAIEQARIASTPQLIQAAGQLFQPGTVAALGGRGAVEDILRDLGAYLPTQQYNQSRFSQPAGTAISDLSGGAPAQRASQGFLDEIAAAVPADVLRSIETGTPLTTGRLAQLEQQDTTALEIYLGARAGEGATSSDAILESLGVTPGTGNRAASTIGSVRL